MPKIPTYIWPITFFLAVGVLLDRIVEPKRYSGEHTGDEEPDAHSYYALAESAYSKLFFGVFEYRFWSAKSFLRLSVISVLVFCATFLVQSIVHKVSFSELTGRWQLFVLVYCIFANIFVDYISLHVTKIMFEFSLLSRKFMSIFVALLSDFLVTINVFVVIGAFFLWGLSSFIWYASTSEAMKKEITASYHIQISPVSDGSRKFRIDFDLSEPRVAGNLSLFPPSFVEFIVEGDFSGRVDAFSPATNYMRVRQVTLNDPATGAEVIVNPTEIEGRKGFNLRPIMERINEIIDGELKLDFVGSIKGVRGELTLDAYLFSFRSVDQVEGRINDLGDEKYFRMPFNRFSNLRFSYSVYSQQEVCMRGKIYTRDRLMSRFDQCEPKVFIVAGRSNNSFLDGYTWIRGLFEPFVPLSTMLLTSFFVTGFLYVVYFAIAVQRYLQFRVFNKMVLVKKFYSRAPFSISGLILGSIVGFLVAQF